MLFLDVVNNLPAGYGGPDSPFQMSDSILSAASLQGIRNSSVASVVQMLSLHDIKILKVLGKGRLDIFCFCACSDQIYRVLVLVKFTWSAQMVRRNCWL